MELIRIIKDQKQELEEGIKNKKIISREAEENFNKLLESNLIKVISGIRRCGKSMLAYMFLKDKDFAYMNFDDERLVDVNSDEILSAFYEVYGKNFKFIFLDEIQNLDKWELFVNRLKRLGFNIFITGSNSKLLGKELATHLTGRHLTIELFPFSFREYLKAVDFKEDTGTTRGNSLLRSEFQKYIDLGGFPEIILEKEVPSIYIRELYRRIVDRDIISRYDISYKKTFKEIAMTLVSNPGTSVSYNKLKNHFNLGSEHTVKNYLSYLEEAYIIFLLSKFSFKLVEVEKSNKKVYVTDTGFTSSLSVKFMKNYGQIYENLVAIELFRKKSFDPTFEIFYWRDAQQREVDFVVKEGLKVKQLIQVCYDISDIGTREREIKILLKASKELKCSNLLIITQDKEGEEKIKGKKIKFIPLFKWLLQEKI